MVDLGVACCIRDNCYSVLEIQELPMHLEKTHKMKSSLKGELARSIDHILSIIDPKDIGTIINSNQECVEPIPMIPVVEGYACLQCTGHNKYFGITSQNKYEHYKTKHSDTLSQRWKKCFLQIVNFSSQRLTFAVNWIGHVALENSNNALPTSTNQLFAAAVDDAMTVRVEALSFGEVPHFYKECGHLDVVRKYGWSRLRHILHPDDEDIEVESYLREVVKVWFEARHTILSIPNAVPFHLRLHLRMNAK